jgi:hypothetical protein
MFAPIIFPIIPWGVDIYILGGAVMLIALFVIFSLLYALWESVKFWYWYYTREKMPPSCSSSSDEGVVITTNNSHKQSNCPSCRFLFYFLLFTCIVLGIGVLVDDPF